MKHLFKILVLFFICNFSFAQSDYRTWIRGKVLYRNSNVISANVVNNTSQKATITNGDGEFEMLVKLNDRLVFSSVQYQIRSLVVTKEILQKSRIVIDVNEKVTQLDEVVVGPENIEKFLDLKEEEFKKVDYTFDKSTKIENQILKAGRLTNGLNFIALYKAIAKSSQKKKIFLAQTLLIISLVIYYVKFTMILFLLLIWEFQRIRFQNFYFIAMINFLLSFCSRKVMSFS